MAVSAGDPAPPFTLPGVLEGARRDYSLEEFRGREKIGYLSPKLATSGSPGTDPEDGDLIYYAPWGNLAFYYDADGVGCSDQTIRLGAFDASPARLGRLEGVDVRVEVVE